MTPRPAPTVARAALAAAAGLVVLAGCAAPAALPAAPTPAAAAQHAGHGDGVSLWATQTGAFRTVVLDGAGRIVYRSDADAPAPPASRCTAECARRWERLTVPDGQEPELLGVDASRVGTLVREDGARQLTLAGWPLYTEATDRGDHNDLGAHGTDGTWFAVAPTGEHATAT